MAIAKLQDIVTSEAAADTVTATYASTPTQGNLLIAWFRANVVVGSFNPPSGWLLATSAIWSASPNSFQVAIYYKVAGASEPTGVTFTATAATVTALGIEEWSGLTPDVNNILDKVAKTDNTGSVTSRSTNTTATTTTANELLVAAVATAAAITSPSWSNSFTAQFAITQMFGATRVVSATGAYETTMSWTTSRNAGACIATFKASPVPIILNQRRQRIEQ